MWYQEKSGNPGSNLFLVCRGIKTAVKERSGTFDSKQSFGEQKSKAHI
jgi:hypothetical protein